MVTSSDLPGLDLGMNSLNLPGVSFFWIWAKCQARKMTTRSDIHSMTVLNVAFTISGPPDRIDDRRLSRPSPGEQLSYRTPLGRPAPGRGIVPM